MIDNTEKLLQMLDEIVADINKASEEANKIQFRIGRDWIMSELVSAYGSISRAKRDARLIKAGYEATKEFWE